MSGSDFARIRDAARLAAVARTGLLDTDPEPAFDELAALAGRLLEAPFAFITLVDEQRSFWKARIGVPDGGPVQNTAEESFCQYVIASGGPLIAGDVTLNPLTANNPSIASMGVRAWAGFPLLTPDGHALGSFCVVDTVVREWSPADVATLGVLAAAASRELTARSHVVQTSIANAHLQLLADVGRALGETLDAAEPVARLAMLVVPVLGDWSLVSLLDADGNLSDVSWQHAHDMMNPVLDRFAGDRLIGLRDSSATVRAQTSRTPIVLDSGSLETGPDVLASSRATEAYRTLNPGVYGVWPLTSGDAVHGVIVIARDKGRPTFTPAEVQLVENIAQRAGTVLDNARLYAAQQEVSAQLERVNTRLRDEGRHDSAVARALQDAMLTRLPEPDHLELTARYLAADAADQVGGDWYDALLPAGGATTLMIGDVAGHDIAAATVMGQLRNVLRALTWDHPEDTPARIITRLDRAMPDLGITSMTTLIVARIEQPADAAREGLRVLRWSCAGHPAPILVPVDGTAVLLEGRADPPLATTRGAARNDHVSVISPGQTLLLYTDGLIETRTDDLDDRQDTLCKIVDANRDRPLDALLDTVLAEMVGRGGPSDDVVLVAVRFHAEDAPRPPDIGAATA